MTEKNYKKSIFLLFLGELFVAIGYLSSLSVIVSGLSFLSLASLAGFVLFLIGAIQLRNANKNFHLVFILVFAMIGVQIIGFAFSFIPLTIFKLLGSACRLVVKAIEVLTFIQLLIGCGLLRGENGLDEGGKRIIMFYVGVIAIDIILGLVALFPIPSLVSMIFVIIETVLSVIGSVIYIVFLNKTYKTME